MRIIDCECDGRDDEEGMNQHSVEKQVSENDLFYKRDRLSASLS